MKRFTYLLLTLLALVGWSSGAKADNYLLGSWADPDGGSWGEPAITESVKFVDNVLSLDLEAGKTYQFKIYDTVTSQYYGNGGEMTETNHSGWTFGTEAGNCRITTTIAGVYTFRISWNGGTPAINVSYPGAYPTVAVRPTFVSSDGATGGEGADKICDANNGNPTGTKWGQGGFNTTTGLRDGDGTVHVVLQANNTILRGYTLWTGGDTGKRPGRRCKAWKLYGSNSATGGWVELDSRYDQQMTIGDKALTQYTVLGNSTEYSYYKLEVSQIVANNEGSTNGTGGTEGMFELSDIMLDVSGLAIVKETRLATAAGRTFGNGFGQSQGTDGTNTFSTYAEFEAAINAATTLEQIVPMNVYYVMPDPAKFYVIKHKNTPNYGGWYMTANEGNLTASASMSNGAIFRFVDVDATNCTFKLQTYNDKYVKAYVGDNQQILTSDDQVVYTLDRNGDGYITLGSGTSNHRFLHYNGNNKIVGWDAGEYSQWTIAEIGEEILSQIDVPLAIGTPTEEAKTAIQTAIASLTDLQSAFDLIASKSTVTDLYLPDGYYYMKGMDTTRHPYLYNKVSDNKTYHTDWEEVAGNQFLWHVTRDADDRSKITLVNGQGTSLTMGNGTKFPTLTFGAYDAARSGIYFTEAINLTNSGKNTTLVTWTAGGANASDNRWTFEDASVSSIYNVIINVENARVTLKSTSETAYNGGFFNITTADLTNEAFEATAIAGKVSTITVDNEQKTIIVQYDNDVRTELCYIYNPEARRFVNAELKPRANFADAAQFAKTTTGNTVTVGGVTYATFTLAVGDQYITKGTEETVLTAYGPTKFTMSNDASAAVEFIYKDNDIIPVVNDAAPNNVAWNWHGDSQNDNNVMGLYTTGDRNSNFLFVTSGNIYTVNIVNGDANTYVTYNGTNISNGGVLIGAENVPVDAEHLTVGGYQYPDVMQIQSINSETRIVTVVRHEGKYLLAYYDSIEKGEGMFQAIEANFTDAVTNLRGNEDNTTYQDALRALLNDYHNYVMPQTGRYFVLNKGTKRYLTNYGNLMNVTTPNYYSIWDIRRVEQDGNIYYTMLNEGAAYAEAPYADAPGNAYLTWDGTTNNHSYKMALDPATAEENGVQVVQPTTDGKAMMFFEPANGWFHLRHKDATMYGVIGSNQSYHGSTCTISMQNVTQDQTLNYGSLAGHENGTWKLIPVSEGADIYNLLVDGRWVTNHSTIVPTKYTEQQLFQSAAIDDNVYYVGGPVTFEDDEISEVQELRALKTKALDYKNAIVASNDLVTGAKNALMYAQVVKDTKALLADAETADYLLQLSEGKKFYLESMDRPDYKARLKENTNNYQAFLDIDDEEELAQWTMEVATGGFYIRNVATGKYMNKNYAPAPTDDLDSRIIINVREAVPGIYYIYNVDREKANNSQKFLTLNGTPSIVHYDVLELSTLWKIKSINRVEVNASHSFGPTTQEMHPVGEGEIDIENPFWYDFYTYDKEHEPQKIDATAAGTHEVFVTTFSHPMSTMIDPETDIIPYVVIGAHVDDKGQLRVDIQQVPKYDDKYYLLRGTGYILVKPTTYPWPDNFAILSNFRSTPEDRNLVAATNKLIPTHNKTVTITDDNFATTYVLNYLTTDHNVGSWDGNTVYGHGFGFYHLNRGKTIALGKAYLNANIFDAYEYDYENSTWKVKSDEANVRAEGIRANAPLSEEAIASQYALLQIVDENGNVTGVLDLATPTTTQGNGLMYDLSGRRVLEPQRGTITIVDGKKKLNK